MRRALLVIALVFASPVFAGPPQQTPTRKAVLLDGLGNIHHPVSTKNAEAQKFFDQGLRLIYAFNHDEAYLAFHRAAQLDPNLAMAHWGMALAVGPNYNLDAEEAALKSAYLSILKAEMLAKGAPAHERAYIGALAKRYTGKPKADKAKLGRDYAAAMKTLHQAYPDDLDAATLYAESLMNLTPWELWQRDGKPNINTLEILSVLERVLRRNPDHTGANHYYIHAIEASPFPERGLVSADRLARMKLKAGHLVHMPAHIYIRTGDHAAAVRANEEAAEVDRAYIQRFKVHGVYPMMYYSHNLHFLAVSHAMQGRFADAKKAADLLSAHVGPHLNEMPMLEFFMPTSTLVLVRFQKWNEVLALPRPDPKQKLVTALWQFARGTAHAELGQTKDAEVMLREFEKAKRGIPVDYPFGDRNPAGRVLTIAESMLKARLAMSRKEPKNAVLWLEKAVAAEDELNYIEPPDWILPCREVLGAALYKDRRFAEAEKTFRADLVQNRRNPRSLFGLMETLKAQGKAYSGSMIEQQFRAAWANADVKQLVLSQY